jgi:hypothetical protein
MAHWMTREGDTIRLHSAEIVVPADTTGLTYGDILRLNGIDTGPDAAALRRAARRYWNRPAVNARWFDDLLNWCRERGIPNEQTIAEWLGVRRETLWHWRQGRMPRPKIVDRIIEKTDGEVDPRKPPTQRRRPSVAEHVALSREVNDKAAASLELSAARKSSADHANRTMRAALKASRRKLDGDGS